MAAPAASSSTSASAAAVGSNGPAFPQQASDGNSSGMGATTATPVSALTPSSYTTMGRRFPTDAVGAFAAAARNTDQSVTLREHMIKELVNGHYDCIVCSETIQRDAPTWACPTCFRLVHLPCAMKWLESCMKGGERGVVPGFRCPACGTSAGAPKNYTCFCGKSVNPKPDPFLTPHSCGEICDKKREHGCVHGRCSLPCHPARCQPCGNILTKRCACSASTYSWPCGTPDPRQTCNAVCGRPLACGNHTCQQLCHNGPCADCDVVNTVQCFCGKTTEALPCGTRRRACDKPCGAPLECGCKCTASCHPPEMPHPPCERDPRLVATCPCGKLDLTDVQQAARTKCADPIPICGRRCGAPLACGQPGHECELLCHDSPHPECQATVSASCACGQQKQVKMRCSEARDFRCQKQCNAPLSCERHFCRNVCCTFRRGQAGVSSEVYSAGELRAAHACHERCNRALLCGHRCMEACHAGACPPCPNIITENLVCGCGAQFRLAPLPCGTVLPPCTRDCPRPRDCGHNALRHTCHHGDCPPCLETVERTCAGGHVSGMRVSCGTPSSSISCGSVCGAALPGCGHPCARKCHDRYGADATTPASVDNLSCISPDTGAIVGKRMCAAECGLELPCGHRCAKRCHYSHALLLQQQKDKASGASADAAASAAAAAAAAAASDDSNNPQKKCPPCEAVVEVPCKCGIQAIKFSCRDYRLWREQHPDPAATAPCAQDCGLLRREAALRPARAAGLGSAADSIYGGAGASGGGFLYTQRLWNAAKTNPDFFVAVEKSFAELISGKENFKKLQPMNNERRRFVHELAWLYGIHTESVDVEPMRAVLLTRTPASRAPNPVLSAAIYTSANAGHNPLVLLQTALANRSRASKHVIVFEGPRLTEVDLTIPLRPFVGRVTLVSSADQLRGVVQHLAPGADRLFRREAVPATSPTSKSKSDAVEISVCLAVFASPSVCTTAFSHLRKQLGLRLVFHLFGESCPPRNVENEAGKLVVSADAAYAFSNDTEDSLWESGVSATDAAAANAWSAARADAAAAERNKGAAPVIQAKAIPASPGAAAASAKPRSPTKSVWGAAPGTPAGGAAASSWATMLRGDQPELPASAPSQNSNNSSRAKAAAAAVSLSNMPALPGSTLASPGALGGGGGSSSTAAAGGSSAAGGDTALIHCPTCTFLNPASRHFCEMCNSALQSASDNNAFDPQPNANAASGNNNNNNNTFEPFGPRRGGGRGRAGAGGGGGDRRVPAPRSGQQQQQRNDANAAAPEDQQQQSGGRRSGGGRGGSRGGNSNNRRQGRSGGGRGGGAGDAGATSRE